MAHPTAYNPAHEFLTDEGANPNFPGSELDIELNAIETTLDEILVNLALIQRADGEIANDSIGIDQLTDAVKAIMGDADALEELEDEIETVAVNAAAAAASATTATTQATNAAASATTATTQATNAASSATTATTQATNAAASATTATTQATNAAASATTATTQATNAANSAASAAAVFDLFDDSYLGSKNANPTLDNDGNPLVEGQIYWNNVSNELRIYDGAAWVAYSPVSGITEVLDDTSPQLGGTLDTNAFDIQFDDAKGIRDDSNNEQLIFQKTASAVNEFEMTNAATGNAPQLAVTGDDADINLNLVPKGTGTVRIAGTRLVASAADPGADRVLIWDESANDWVAATLGTGIEISGTTLRRTVSFMVCLSDETTAITTGTNKATLSLPRAFTVTSVYATLNTASSSGIPTVDINEAGTTILSTKLTIDANEKTSATAAAAAVISDAAIAANAEIGFDIDVAGTGAKGLKVFVEGNWA